MTADQAGCGHVAHFYSAGLQWGRTADDEAVRCLVAGAVPAIPPDQAMPSDARKRLQEAAKAPGVVALWRHRDRSCRRFVAVAAMAGEWLTVRTHLGRRVMLDQDREGATLSDEDGPVRIITAIAPLPVAVRCCGPVWTIEWAEVWRVAQNARRAGCVETVEASPKP